MSGDVNNYPKQFYSQSSTNLNYQSYDLTDSEIKVMKKPKTYEKNSLQYSSSQQNNNRQLSNGRS